MSFVDDPNGSATLSGTPADGTGGVYPISITASNKLGSSATQSFTLTIDEAPTITSTDATTFTVGAVGTFTVTASGYPAPSFSESVALPQGLSFADNGNGTATLAGTPESGSGGVYGINIVASNAVGSTVSQSFTLTVNGSPTITSASSTTFMEGVEGVFMVTASGYPTPSFSESGVLPSGVSFVDNGNGMAALAGIPAPGTAGLYPIGITASNDMGTSAKQSFSLTVGEAPVITSADSAAFTEGKQGTFTVTASGYPDPTLSETGDLPNGVTFDSSTGVLSGIPASGSSESYAITFSASNGVGAAAIQSFTLSVIPGSAAVVQTVGSLCAGPISDDGTHVWVGCGSGVAELDASTGKVVRRFPWVMNREASRRMELASG